MQKTLGILAGLLLAQLVLAIGMSFTGPNLAALPPDTPLLDLDDQTVDRLTIEAPDSQQLVLVRQGEGWVLPQTGDFPADKTRVEKLLGRLKELHRGMAVATTGGALKRFKVSDDAFERRLTLMAGDATLATLYLGTSPGMRQVHARTSKDDAVYTTEFGIFEAPVKAEDWEDKGILRIPRERIESISLGGLTLTRAPAAQTDTAGDAGAETPPPQAAWSGAGLGDAETINQANADSLIRQVAELSIGSVLGSEAQPEYGLETPALVISVQPRGAETVEYRMGKRKGENDYVLKASNRAEFFRLPAYTGDALLKAAEREQLVMEGGTPGKTQAGVGTGPSTPPSGVAEPAQPTSAGGAS